MLSAIAWPIVGVAIVGSVGGDAIRSDEWPWMVAIVWQVVFFVASLPAFFGARRVMAMEGTLPAPSRPRPVFLAMHLCGMTAIITACFAVRIFVDGASASVFFLLVGLGIVESQYRVFCRGSGTRAYGSRP